MNEHAKVAELADAPDLGFVFADFALLRTIAQGSAKQQNTKGLQEVCSTHYRARKGTFLPPAGRLNGRPN
jgi:hypothetical protein